CDLAENCNGSSVNCPADAKSTAVCRAATGACDAPESCDGSSNNCPADALRPSGFVCRAAAGDCDVAESCSGSSAACPADGFKSASVECRASTGICDPAENCTGSSATCPADPHSPDADGDGLCHAIHNCPNDPNPGQQDDNRDGIRTACDPCNNNLP